MDRFTTIETGGLRCHLLDALPEGAHPDLLVVLCHGFGAPGTDLVPLGPEIVQRQPPLSACVRFAFPEAPLTLQELGPYGGRAWWRLDVERISAAIQRGELRHEHGDQPDGLSEAREALVSLVRQLAKESGIQTNQVVLGGFSQGSMVATDVALRLPELPAGLCIFSGTLLCEDEWRRLAEQRGPMPVLQTHGYEDPLLPFQGAEWLRDLLTEAGLAVEFLPFHGLHTIPAEGVERLARMLAGICDR